MSSRMPQALHSEINRWFANQSEIYSSTVQLQLRVSVVGAPSGTCGSHIGVIQLRHHSAFLSLETCVIVCQHCVSQSLQLQVFESDLASEEAARIDQWN